MKLIAILVICAVILTVAIGVLAANGEFEMFNREMNIKSITYVGSGNPGVTEINDSNSESSYGNQNQNSL